MPIHCIDFTIPSEEKIHHDLVALVDKMFELHKASFDSEKGLHPAPDCGNGEED